MCCWDAAGLLFPIQPRICIDEEPSHSENVCVRGEQNQQGAGAERERERKLTNFVLFFRKLRKRKGKKCLDSVIGRNPSRNTELLLARPGPSFSSRVGPCMHHRPDTHHRAELSETRSTCIRNPRRMERKKKKAELRQERETNEKKKKEEKEA